MISERLQGIFIKVFNDPNLVVTDTLSSKDVDDWDSLNHIYLVSAIEQEFNVRFSTTEIAQLQNVGDLRNLLEQKLT